MKKVLLSALSFILAGAFSISSAQLDGSDICPNFTATDLNGVTHTLYDYLDQGKVVYVDISATWCNPCWSYKNTGIMEDMYSTYGPDGTDEIMILFVEGDVSTTIDDLYGTGSNTLGDWVTGTTFPIIEDDGSINSALKIAYFPTLYVVYPNRTVEEVNKVNDAGTGYATPAELRDREKEGQELSTTTLDARIFYTPALDPIDCDGYMFPKVRVQNYGTEKITSATINMWANDSLIKTTNMTTPLNQYETFYVNYGFIQLPNGSYEVKFEVVNPNSGTDVATDNDSQSMWVDVNKNALKPQLTITPDGYASETTWRILDWNNNIVASGGDYTDGAKSITKSLCLLDNQCYNFIIEDGYGDGFSNTAGAGGTIALDGSDLMTFGTSDHTGAIFQQEFCVGAPTGIQDNNAEEIFDVFPVPTSSITNVTYTISQNSNVRISVLNLLGEVVADETLGTQAAGNYTSIINVNHLNSGVYFLNLSIGSETKTKKIVVK